MNIWLRMGAATAIAVGLSFALAPSLSTSLAQGRGAMWCSAKATDGIETSYYYSKVFSANAAEAGARATRFQAEVEASEASASDIEARCYPAADAAAASRALEAAFASNEGQRLDWPE